MTKRRCFESLYLSFERHSSHQHVHCHHGESSSTPNYNAIEIFTPWLGSKSRFQHQLPSLNYFLFKTDKILIPFPWQ